MLLNQYKQLIDSTVNQVISMAFGDPTLANVIPSINNKVMSSVTGVVADVLDRTFVQYPNPSNPLGPQTIQNTVTSAVRGMIGLEARQVGVELQQYTNDINYLVSVLSPPVQQVQPVQQMQQYYPQTVQSPMNTQVNSTVSPVANPIIDSKESNNPLTQGTTMNRSNHINAPVDQSNYTVESDVVEQDINHTEDIPDKTDVHRRLKWMNGVTAEPVELGPSNCLVSGLHDRSDELPILYDVTNMYIIPTFNGSAELSNAMIEIFISEAFDELVNVVLVIGKRLNISDISIWLDRKLTHIMDELILHRFGFKNVYFGSYFSHADEINGWLTEHGIYEDMERMALYNFSKLLYKVQVEQANTDPVAGEETEKPVYTLTADRQFNIISMPWPVVMDRKTNEVWITGYSRAHLDLLMDDMWTGVHDDTYKVRLIDNVGSEYNVYRRGTRILSPTQYTYVPVDD